MADQYETEVNKGDLNMNALQRNLNKRYEDGWRLAHVIAEAGNVIFIWERFR